MSSSEVLERGGETQQRELAVQDLYSITPDQYLGFGDGVVHNLSTYGFDNDTSSYRVGACSSVIRSSAPFHQPISLSL